jgi:hypothetical protein
MGLGRYDSVHSSRLCPFMPEKTTRIHNETLELIGFDGTRYRRAVSS